jgi:hypothetical protein
MEIAPVMPNRAGRRDHLDRQATARSCIGLSLSRGAFFAGPSLMMRGTSLIGASLIMTHVFFFNLDRTNLDRT